MDILYSKFNSTTNFSDMVLFSVNLLALPKVSILTPEITETYIHVKWEYSKADQNRRQFDDDDDVGIVVKYNNENEENFKRYPEDENSKIPASDQSARIDGEFDTTLSHQFKYLIKEGDQISFTEYQHSPSRDHSSKV